MDILSVTLPVFLLIGLGYLTVRLGWVAKSAVSGMGNYVIYCALPALLFSALSSRDFSEILNPVYLAVFALGSLSVLALGLVAARKKGRQPLQRAAFSALGGSMTNSAFIGYAIVVQLFGTAAVVGVALTMLVDLILLLPITIAVAEAATHDAGTVRHAALASFKHTLTNPLVIAITAGLLASLLQWQPPAGALERTLELLAGSASAVSLFVIGGTLVGVTPRGRLTAIGQIAFFKLALHPLIVAFMVWLLPPFDPVLQATAIILASMPMPGIFPLLGQRYGEEALCATALVSATGAALVSINLVLWLLQQQGMLLTTP